MMMSKLGCRFSWLLAIPCFQPSFFLIAALCQFHYVYSAASVYSTEAPAHSSNNPIHAGSPSMVLMHTGHTLKASASSSLLAEVSALSYWRALEMDCSSTIDLCHFLCLVNEEIANRVLPRYWRLSLKFCLMCRSRIAVTQASHGYTRT